MKGKKRDLTRRGFLKSSLVEIGGLSGICGLFGCYSTDNVPKARVGCYASHTSGTMFVNPRDMGIHGELSEKGGIVSIEGLQPFAGCECTDICSKIARKYKLAFSSSSWGGKDHVDFIEKIAEKKGKIILVGYSAGAEIVWNAAKELKSKKIPVDLMVYLDPTHQNDHNHKIPLNVRRIVSVYGDNSGSFGGNYLDGSDLESIATKYQNEIIPNCRHLELPGRKEVEKILSREVERVVF